MDKGQRTRKQTIIYKTAHEYYRLSNTDPTNTGVNSGAPDE
jgi:hypothetical protein